MAAELTEAAKLKIKRRENRRQSMLSFGVYLVVVAGILASQAVVMHDNLNMTLRAVELGQVAGASLVALFAYNKLEEDRALMKNTRKNTFRVMRNAFYHGFFWMTIVGVWW